MAARGDDFGPGGGVGGGWGIWMMYEPLCTVMLEDHLGEIGGGGSGNGGSEKWGVDHLVEGSWGYITKELTTAVWGLIYFWHRGQ